jgi:hypothetical protein
MRYGAMKEETTDHSIGAVYEEVGREELGC